MRRGTTLPAAGPTPACLLLFLLSLVSLASSAAASAPSILVRVRAGVVFVVVVMVLFVVRYHTAHPSILQAMGHRRPLPPPLVPLALLAPLPLALLPSRRDRGHARGDSGEEVHVVCYCPSCCLLFMSVQCLCAVSVCLVVCLCL